MKIHSHSLIRQDTQSLTEDGWCLLLCSCLSSSKVISDLLSAVEPNRIEVGIKQMPETLKWKALIKQTNKKMILLIMLQRWFIQRDTVCSISAIPLQVTEYNLTPDTLLPMQMVSAPNQVVPAGSDMSHRTHRGSKAGLLSTANTLAFWDNVYQDSNCL